MKQHSVLITGGAGYIGSHAVHRLVQNGEWVITVDNLSTGFAEAVPYPDLVIGDVNDKELIEHLMHTHHVEAVIHFAASTIVPESVADPVKYYNNNTFNTQSLLKCCVKMGVKHFIFSSTAAVYGTPTTDVVTEQSPCLPINPYGRSKLMSEWMIQDIAKTCDLKYTILRYFNVAGAHSDAINGNRRQQATTLVKVASQAAMGLRDHVDIYGTDYPTVDGTGVRDYIHVEDLVMAHEKALHYLRQGGKSGIFNCGYGHGFSVQQVLDSVNQQMPITTKVRERRAGDPATVIADSSLIRSTMGWQPKYDDLDTIIEHSLAWEKAMLKS